MASLIDDDITLQTMRDPINLQKLVLDDISSRLTGNKVIVDPNQVSMLLIEMGANLTSNLARATEETLSAQLAKRALTTEELYKHMSDFDYVNLFSTPSSTIITLTLDKTYLYNKALDYNEVYKLVVIPQNTVFKLGTLTFGIYYPINIRINKANGFISTVWDTTKENPLYTLNTNYLSSISQSYLGFEFLHIDIPVFQFTRTRSEYTVTPGVGFAQKVSYSDDFYAARFFTNAPNSTDLVEFHQELGKDSYDPKTLTMRMQVLLDESAISINTPQIYIDDNMVGSKIYVDVYTTKGNISPSLASLDTSQLKANFNLNNNSSIYSKILSTIPTCYINMKGDRPSGGSDGLTFNELRERVVHNSFHTTALITPIDLENFFSDKGFRVVKYKDDLTNLIYFAYKLLKDNDGNIIPSANLNITLKSTSGYEDSIDEVSNIVFGGTNEDGTVVYSQINNFVNLHTYVYECFTFDEHLDDNVQEFRDGSVDYVVCGIFDLTKVFTEQDINSDNWSEVSKPYYDDWEAFKTDLIGASFNGYQYSINEDRENITYTVSFRKTYTHIKGSNQISFKDYDYSFKQFTADHTVTILPTTIYKYDDSNLSCTPLTNDERDTLTKLSKEEQVAFFNESTYTSSPFHIRLITSDRYPYASSYNLMNPEISHVKFVKENNTITAQMTICGLAIVHNDRGTGGYTIRMMCQQSQDLITVAEEDIVVYLYAADKNGTYCGLVGSPVKDSDGNIIYNDGIINYDFNLTSNYHIDKDHRLALTSLSSNNVYESSEHFFDLDTTFHALFMINTANYPDFTNANNANMNDIKNIVPDEFIDYIVMIEQQFDIKLGYALDDVVYNSIDLQWGGANYATYQSDVIKTYDYDVYETDQNGVPVYTIDEEGNVVFNKIHSKGETVYYEDVNTDSNLTMEDDASKTPVYKYKKGEVRLDEDGFPIITEDRVLKYNIQALMIDYKVYICDNQASIDYVTELPSILETYFETIRIATDNLLERDKVYFKPIRTLGSGQFDVGDNVTVSMPLEMSVKFKAYLNNEAYSNDSLRNGIEEQMIEIIEEQLINKRVSLGDMVEIFKSRISHIEAIDVLGINGSTDLQTLTIADDSIQPSIKQIAYVTKDNKISIKKDVSIEFARASLI